MGSSPLQRITHRWVFQSMRIIVVVVVECCCFLINIIVEPPGAWRSCFVLVFTAFLQHNRNFIVTKRRAAELGPLLFLRPSSGSFFFAVFIFQKNHCFLACPRRSFLLFSPENHPFSAWPRISFLFLKQIFHTFSFVSVLRAIWLHTFPPKSLHFQIKSFHFQFKSFYFQLKSFHFT